MPLGCPAMRGGLRPLFRAGETTPATDYPAKLPDATAGVPNHRQPLLWDAKYYSPGRDRLNTSFTTA